MNLPLFFFEILFLSENNARQTGFSELDIWQTFFQRKQSVLFVATFKFLAFKQKLKFWKMCIHNRELNFFPVLKDFSDDISGSNN